MAAAPNPGSGHTPITMVIATRDRSALVSECVESLLLQNCAQPFAVLVVDNGSRDDTCARMADIAARDARLTYAHEPQPGVSRTRNHALALDATDYALFVDDECTFPQGYLQRAQELAKTRRPAAFGGPIHPRYRDDKPDWFRDEYASFSLPHHAAPGDIPALSAGNLGVRIDALRAVGGFADDYGPKGRRMGHGEENILCARLMETFGADAVIYDPQLVNHHLVRPEKYLWSHILRENISRGLARGRFAATFAPDAARSGTDEPATSQPSRRDGVKADLAAFRWRNLLYEVGMAVPRRAAQWVGQVQQRIGKRGA